MSYLDGPNRPAWFKPVLIAWALLGLPVIPLGMMWVGSFNPLPIPPGFESFADALSWSITVAWTHVTPFILLAVEWRYRRSLHAWKILHAED